MIPKIIHYCWLSDEPIPQNLQKYIEGWKKLMPDYQFKKWDTAGQNRGSAALPTLPILLYLPKKVNE